MKKINVSLDKIDKFSGLWVAIDPLKKNIIASGKTLSEISPLVTRPISDKRPSGTVPYSFLVPREDEGPYILTLWSKPQK